MKILIAEDALTCRSFLGKFFEKYGDCDLVADGLEALDAFLTAVKEGEPYQLICLDIMMPKVDGLKVLKTIRDLEKQHNIAPEQKAKIIMTTALDEAKLVRTSFDYGGEVYAAKPIDTKRLMEVMEKLGLTEKARDGAYAHMSALDLDFEIGQVKGRYFKNVCALPDYQLEVSMETGTTIRFDFRSRLNTARFGMLKDCELFRSVCTDGNYLIFNKAGKMPVKVAAADFMDLVLIDRRQ